MPRTKAVPAWLTESLHGAIAAYRYVLQRENS